jgi:hypothetical protein
VPHSSEPPSPTAWYGLNLRFSPIGLTALLLSLVGSSAYVAGVALPIAKGTIVAVLDSRTHNTEIMITILASGMAILLSLVSFGLESAPLPSLIAFCLLIVVENVLFPMMPIWTLMLAPWELSLLYGFAFAAAVVLIAVRLARKLAHAR